MKALTAITVLLACTSVRAAQLDYVAGRRWVEQQCVTNQTPQEQCLFVARMELPRVASIIRFRKGINLREIIDQTPLKGKVVHVCVMRPDRIKSGPFTRREFITVGPSETPSYELKSLDVIWLYDDDVIITT